METKTTNKINNEKEKQPMSKAIELLKEAISLLETKEKTETESGKVELSTLKAGDTFKIGEHDFIVLEQTNGQTMVISKGLMAENKVFDSNCRDYSESSLKKFIESNIQPIIEKEIGADNIIEHEVDLTSVDMQNEFGKCECKVRPITFDEARKYNDLLVDKNLPDWFWTCTPWSIEDRGWKHSVAVVSPSGFIYDLSCDCDGGVRPFCILKSNIFESGE